MGNKKKRKKEKKRWEEKKKVGKYICLLANIYILHSIYTYSIYT